MLAPSFANSLQQNPAGLHAASGPGKAPGAAPAPSFPLPTERINPRAPTTAFLQPRVWQSPCPPSQPPTPSRQAELPPDTTGAARLVSERTEVNHGSQETRTPAHHSPLGLRFCDGKENGYHKGRAKSRWHCIPFPIEMFAAGFGPAAHPWPCRLGFLHPAWPGYKSRLSMKHGASTGALHTP